MTNLSTANAETLKRALDGVEYLRKAYRFHPLLDVNQRLIVLLDDEWELYLMAMLGKHSQVPPPNPGRPRWTVSTIWGCQVVPLKEYMDLLNEVKNDNAPVEFRVDEIEGIKEVIEQ